MPQKGVAPAHLQKKRRGKKTNLGRRHKGCDKNKKRAAAATKTKISQEGKRKACDTIEQLRKKRKCAVLKSMFVYAYRQIGYTMISDQ